MARRERPATMTEGERGGAGTQARVAPASAGPAAHGNGNQAVRAVARAVLYEGYVLWPYRRSALKNRRRWTYGGVYPPGWTERGHPDDPCDMRVEVLLEHDGAADTDVSVGATIRFLQIMKRRVAERREDELRQVAELAVDGRRYVEWDEAVEREVILPRLKLEASPAFELPLHIPAGSQTEWIEDGTGRRAGALVRTWSALAGTVRIERTTPAPGLTKLAATIANTTHWNGQDREDALERTFVSTHVVLDARGAAFVSLTDPPPRRAEVARACVNTGTWPVLAGTPPARDTMLCSPIILPDYPRIAPESPGDLFDSGEIDELLALNILALTDAEKEEMRASDPRAAEILDRTSQLTREQLLQLHGRMRETSQLEEP